MNGVDFPVEPGARRDRGRARGGLRPDQGEHGRPARDQRVVDRADGPLGPGRGPHPAVHRVHGRRPLQRLAARRGRARRPRSSPRSPPRCRSRRSRRTTRARWPIAGATPDGGGEVGVIASVTAPFCGACTRARISADGQLYTCLFAVKGTDLRGPSAERGVGCRADGAAIRAVWSVRADRYSELRSEATADLPAGRDVRDGRVGRSRAGLSTGRPQRRKLVDTLRTASWPNFVDKRVDPVRAGSYRRSCPKGPSGTRVLEITSTVSSPLPVASGASRPGSCDLTIARRGRPEGSDRHPGVGTPPGRRRQSPVVRAGLFLWGRSSAAGRPAGSALPVLRPELASPASRPAAARAGTGRGTRRVRPSSRRPRLATPGRPAVDSAA